MSIAVFGDIVEGNGRTIRQNNIARAHAIPLGAFVEIDCPDVPEWHG